MTNATAANRSSSLTALWQAIEAAAAARHHKPSAVARFVGLHAAHYYRIRTSPGQIARCRPDVLARFAEYVGWTVLDVYLGVGLIDPNDLWLARSSAATLAGALDRAAHSRFGSGLTTPISNAAPDHQLFIARLHTALELQSMQAQEP